jgi:hypothetical protein
MAILKSADGRFYDIPDKDTEKYVIPADQVRDRLDAAGISPPTGGGGPAGDSATIVIKVLGGAVSVPQRGGMPAVAAYNHHCHNCGRGCGRNCGHGCGHHCH